MRDLLLTGDRAAIRKHSVNFSMRQKSCYGILTALARIGNTVTDIMKQDTEKHAVDGKS